MNMFMNVLFPIGPVHVFLFSPFFIVYDYIFSALHDKMIDSLTSFIVIIVILPQFHLKTLSMHFKSTDDCLIINDIPNKMSKLLSCQPRGTVT